MDDAGVVAGVVQPPEVRDRASDESGNQIGITNRLGARPFNADDLNRFLYRGSSPITVENSTPRPKR